MLSDTNRCKLPEPSDSTTSRENTSRDTSPMCVKFGALPVGRRRRRGSESGNSNLHTLPGLTFLLDPEGKVGISSQETATTEEAGTGKAEIGNVAKKQSADEFNGTEDNNKWKSDAEVVHQLVSRRMATGEEGRDIVNDIDMAEKSDSVAPSPMESAAAVKLRWKIAARKIQEQQSILQQDGDQDNVYEGFETYDASAANADDNEDCSGQGEAAWSRLFKKLHDEKLLMLEKSNLFGETIRGHSKGIRAKGKVATETLREKSQSASRIVKERSVSASKAVKDRSNSATRAMRSVSTSSKKSQRSRSPRQRGEAPETDPTLNKEGRRFLKLHSTHNFPKSGGRGHGFC